MNVVFTGSLDAHRSRLQLRGPDGAQLAEGRAHDEDETVMTIDLTGIDSAPGAHVLRWTAVARAMVTSIEG
ncbi:hypothetical protein BH20CHL6_BH20CHL6_05930 [soil metagenome]